MSKAINLIFPHQLFEESPLIDNGHEVFLIEEHLFFKQYLFHKQKIAFHRATMKYYQHYLKSKNIKVTYLDANNQYADIRNFKKILKQEEVSEIHLIDPIDFWLQMRIDEISRNQQIKIYESPLFINTRKELSDFFRPDKKSFFQTTFYKQQRKNLDILLDKNKEPIGGKWTFDKENRKKYPKHKSPPIINYPNPNTYWEEALTYVNQHFSDNPGELSKQSLYAVTHKAAESWFEQFLKHRFDQFGIYEDAIVEGESYLNHSVLSPLINVGLINPKYVVTESLSFAKKNEIPINSTEGFIRQIIGWREFIRGMYICKGNYLRSKNFWNFNRKIPKCFYDGTTGILPLDQTIKQVLKTGYCHHIERLMILGNLMLLCEFDPNEVYQWFMELFIDAYDWVMVPNIYGMSQLADGGLFATKPYIGGSNYIRKMSNYPKGPWEEVWDGLFWEFINNHQDFFKSNPRTSMLYFMYQKMDPKKKKAHTNNAKKFIDQM